MNRSYLQQVRKEIRAMTVYQPSSLDFAVKLDAMENPYAMPPTLRAGWNAALADCAINRYPDSTASALKSSLAAYAEVPSPCRLLLGNGSDELIQLIMLALACDGACVISPSPGFVIYHMAAVIAGMSYLPAPLDTTDFSLDREQMMRLIKQHQPALICLAQPNNPTGNLWDNDDVKAIIQEAPGYVLLDEAYAPFARQSQMQLLKKYANLMVLRTFSKIGFAGMRLGFLAANPDVIEHLNKLRLPYNVSTFAQRGIRFILDNFAPVQQQIDHICHSRDTLFQTLSSMPDITPFPSKTNFILLRIGDGRAYEVFNRLKQKGVLVKSFPTSSELSDCLRVTVGSDKENCIFVRALREILDSHA